MLLVGLTGGIGSGKTSVSSRLAERGAVVVDADAIVRELQAPGQAVLAAMVERFGEAILLPDGSLDRQAVADMVFNDVTPELTVDPQTYEVRVDGELATCEPAHELALAQRYFLF